MTFNLKRLGARGSPRRAYGHGLLSKRTARGYARQGRAAPASFNLRSDFLASARAVGTRGSRAKGPSAKRCSRNSPRDGPSSTHSFLRPPAAPAEEKHGRVALSKTVADVPGPYSLPILGTRWIFSRFGCYRLNKIHEAYKGKLRRCSRTSINPFAGTVSGRKFP